MADRNVSVEVTGKVQSFIRSMDEAGAKADTTAGKMSHTFEKSTSKIGGLFTGLGAQAAAFGVPFTGVLDKVGAKFDAAKVKGEGLHGELSALGGVTAAATGVALVGIGAASIHLADKFDTATGRVAASAGISEGAAKKIGQAFLTTAGSTTFSATEMSDAYAGVAGQLGQLEGHALTGAKALDVMRAAGDLAEATHTDLATATHSLSNVMTDFGMKAADAATASDILTGTARATGLGVGDVSSAIDKLHGRLGQVSPSLADTGGLLDALASQGIRGGRGVTTVSTAMTTLLGGGKATKDLLTTLGVHVFDASGKFVGMSSVISQLHPIMAKMTDQQKLLAEKTLFGASAAQVLGQVIDGGPEKFKKYRDAVSKAGAAHDAAGVATNNLHGQVKKLKVVAEDLGIQFGEVLVPILGKVVGALSDTIGWFMKNKDAAIALAVVAIPLLGAAMSIFVYDKVASFVSGIQRVLTGLGLLKVQAEETAATVEASGATIAETSMAGGAGAAAGGAGAVGAEAAAAGGAGLAGGAEAAGAGAGAASGGLASLGASAAALAVPLAMVGGVALGLGKVFGVVDDESIKVHFNLGNMASESVPELASKFGGLTHAGKMMDRALGDNNSTLAGAKTMHQEFNKVLDQSPEFAQKYIDAVKKSGGSTEWYSKQLLQHSVASEEARTATERYGLQQQITEAQVRGDTGAVYGLTMQLGALPTDKQIEVHAQSVQAYNDLVALRGVIDSINTDVNIGVHVVGDGVMAGAAALFHG